MPKQHNEMEQPIVGKLTIKEVELIVGRAPDDVYLENKRVVCTFNGAFAATIRFHLSTV